MKIEARHSSGQIVFEITAENANDRALLGIFDEMNSPKAGSERRIVCGSSYSGDLHGITRLCIAGLGI